MKAEKIVVGKIYLSDGTGKTAEAMAIADGKVVAVGREEEILALRSEGTEVIRREGLVIPGITEGHAHVTGATEELFGVALGHEEDPSAYLEKIEGYIKTHPGVKAVIGSGYDNGVFGPEGPKTCMLDTVCRDVPAVMIASDHHSRWLNTKAMELAGITKDSVSPLNGEIVRDRGGNPTGWLKESAMALANPVIPATEPSAYAAAIGHYQQIALSYGVTNVFEPMFDPLRDYSARAEGYRLLDKSGGLYLTARLGYSIEADDDAERAFGEILSIKDRLSDCENVSLTTAKFFADGVVECHTAYLSQDYCDTPGDRGIPTMSGDELTKLVLRSVENGLDVHIHVIGDAALDMALDAFSAANVVYGEGEADLRGAVTHLQIVRPDQIERMKNTGAYAVTNPYWHYFSKVYYDELELPYLGEERASKEYPMRSLVQAGVPVSVASDFPVTTPPNTMQALGLMVTRRDPADKNAPALCPGERIALCKALDALTAGGAKQLRLDGRKGKLVPGMDADFAVLDRDPFAIPPEEICDISVDETYISGILRYKK